MKKTVALFLALLMTLSCFPVFVGAEETPILTTPGESGENFTYTFTDPVKKVYLLDEPLDMTGAYISYESGGETIAFEVGSDSTGVTITGFDSTATGEKTITVEYKDPDATLPSMVHSFTVTVVAESTLQGMYISQQPTKWEYIQGEPLDLTGGILTREFDTHTEDIPLTDTRITVEGYVLNKSGPQTLRVYYDGTSDEKLIIEIMVNEPLRPDHIGFAAGKEPKRYYLVGETLDLSEIVLDVQYSDGSSKQIGADDPAVTVTGFDSSRHARLDLTFEYDGGNRVYQVFISQMQGKCGDDLEFTFDNATGTLTITGTGAMYDYDYSYTATPWAGYGDQIKRVALPNGITTLGEYAFNGCYNLESINLPQTLTTISQFAFNCCMNLKLGGNDIPSSVQTIGQYAFSDCAAITDLVIPEGVTVIEDYAFSYMNNLEDITLPQSLKIIGNAAFMSCPMLKTIDIPNGLQAIRSVAFQSSGLTEFTIPGTVTEIAYMAFYETHDLKEVTFEGDAPAIQHMGGLVEGNIFSGWEYPGSKAINAYYPGGNATWTDTARADYEATYTEFASPNITWIPTYGVTDNETGLDPEVDGLDKVQKDLDELLEDLPNYDPSKKNTVALVISNVAIDTTDPDTMEAIEEIEKVGNEKNIDYMDITLNHLANGEVVVHEDNHNLGSKNNHLLVITLSYDSLGKKNMVVFRYHNGKVDTLTQDPNSDGEFIEVNNGKLIIHAMKFSTYGVGYDPIPVVSFDTNEGSTIAAREVEAGQKITKPADPTKDHYMFRGWYKDEALTETWDFDTDTVAADTTLYAKWEALIPVAFHANGGTEVNALEVASGSKLTKPTDPTKDGHLFRGWYKDEALTEAWDFETDTVTADITLYAKWEAGFAVTFNSNGGSTVASQLIAKDGKVTEPSEPTKTNYCFSGWYKNEALTELWDFDTDTVTSAITLYAKWTETPSGPIKESQVDASGAANFSPTVSGLDEIVEADDSDDDVVVRLSIDAVDAAQVPTAEKTAIQGAAAGRELIFFDINLTKSVNGGNAVDIGGQNSKLLSITLSLPTTGKTHFKVFRYHGSGVDVLTETANSYGEKITVGSNTITVHAKRFSTYAVGYMENGEKPTSTITGVTVGPEGVRLRRGETKTFAATVTGTEDYDDSVTWSVSGNKSKDTKINSKGKLTIAENESARTLTVKATSKQDAAKSDTVTVTVRKAASNANTGDTFNPVLWLSVMGISAVGILLLILLIKKRKSK